MSLSFGLFENVLSRFMEDIAATKSAWTKSELTEKWNELMGEPAKKNEPKKVSEKPVEKKPDSDRCIFKITRGDKMGEQCTSRAKKSLGTLMVPTSFINKMPKQKRYKKSITSLFHPLKKW